jgi:hypothetical protein
MNKFKDFSSFDSQKRLKLFKKDLLFEELLESLNSNLFDSEKIVEKQLESKKSYPPILIISSPRTGSTYLSQLMAAKLKISYVSNLMSKFYNVPILGAYLQKNMINNKDIKELKTFHSIHGNTSNIYEPSEFGYFWSRHFNFGKNHHEPSTQNLKNIDFKKLNYELENISKVFEAPVLYKCSIGPFLIKQILSKTDVFVIVLNRNKTDTVNSILKTRKERFGNYKVWWSIRPFGFESMQKEKPLLQVQWQYDKVFKSLDSYDKNKYQNRVYNCNYEDLIKSSNNELKAIAKKYFLYSKINVLENKK